MAADLLQEKEVAEAVKKVDISHSGLLYHIERPLRTNRANLHTDAVVPIDRVMSDVFRPDTPTRVEMVPDRPARPVRKHLEEFILRDYGVLEVTALKSSLQLRNATIKADEENRTFEIVERNKGFTGSAFSTYTIVVEARDEHEFKAWSSAFKMIQDLQFANTYSVYPNGRSTRGSNGMVVEGMSDSDGSPIVVKIISRDTAPIPALVETFVGKRLTIVMPQQYPDYLVRCQQVYHTPRETHVVMELIPGPPLHDWLEKYGPMEDADAHLIFKQVLLAVEYLHTLGILHGGVTTRNVLICDPNPEAKRVKQVKLIDFSATSMKTGLESDLYYPLRDLDEYKRSLGSDGLEYIAPELWEDNPASLLTDYWCLGCMLYRMLVGPLPFAAGDADPWDGVMKNGEKIGGELQRFAHETRVDLQQDMLFPKDRPRVAFLTSDARSILFQLLRPNRSQRLGPRSITRHPWIAIRREQPPHMNSSRPRTQRLFK